MIIKSVGFGFVGFCLLSDIHFAKSKLKTYVA